MSTATTWPDDIGAAGGPFTRPAGRRGHLRVVRPGESVPAPARSAQGGGRAALHLTRRGRLALTSTVAVVLVLAMLALLGVVGPAGAMVGEEIVVQPGQTLSQLASTHLPDRPLDEAILQIQLVNGLSTAHVQAGQVLMIEP